MTEEQYRRWDIAAKFIAPLIAVMALLIGIRQFSQEQANIRQREFDLLQVQQQNQLKREYWQEQKKVITHTISIVGNLASQVEDEDKFKLAAEEFFRLYWGNLVLVEDDALRKELVKFNLDVQDFPQGLIGQEQLKKRASQLADSLNRTLHDLVEELAE